MKRPGAALTCLGEETRHTTAAWDLMILGGGVWGAWVGARYNRPATGAALGMGVPMLVRIVLDAARGGR